MPFIKLEDGTVAHIKMSVRKNDVCSVCRHFLSDALCDFREPGSGSTCSAPLCEHCAVHVAPNLDYCPHHDLPPQQTSLFGAAA